MLRARFPSRLLVEAAAGVEEACRQTFARTTSLTVGLEEELVLLDPSTLQPAGEIDRALLRLEDDRFTCELRTAQLEVVTPPCATIVDACRELRGARLFAVDRLDGFARVLAAGVHPSSTTPVEVTDRPRYREIVDDSPWSIREGLPCGLHVHVGLAGSQRALAVYNAARSYLPELAALGANSPFLSGEATGLASTRLKLNDAFPRAGIPPAFETWSDYGDFVSWATCSGVFPDESFLWWELRLHPIHGTLEFRVADAQTRVVEAGAIAAVCQALVAALAEHHDAGRQLPVHDTHRIAENRWRALRDGPDATLVDLDTGVPAPARERIGRLLATLEPYAEALGARNELLAAWTLLAENGAERQRRIAAELGVEELVRRLADETEARTATVLAPR